MERLHLFVDQFESIVVFRRVIYDDHVGVMLLHLLTTGTRVGILILYIIMVTTLVSNLDFLGRAILNPTIWPCTPVPCILLITSTL